VSSNKVVPGRERGRTAPSANLRSWLREIGHGRHSKVRSRPAEIEAATRQDGDEPSSQKPVLHRATGTGVAGFPYGVLVSVLPVRVRPASPFLRRRRNERPLPAWGDDPRSTWRRIGWRWWAFIVGYPAALALVAHIGLSGAGR
jgi:hypothetical protein